MLSSYNLCFSSEHGISFLKISLQIATSIKSHSWNFQVNWSRVRRVMNIRLRLGTKHYDNWFQSKNHIFIESKDFFNQIFTIGSSSVELSNGGSHENQCRRIIEIRRSQENDIVKLIFPVYLDQLRSGFRRRSGFAELYAW